MHLPFNNKPTPEPYATIEKYLKVELSSKYPFISIVNGKLKSVKENQKKAEKQLAFFEKVISELQKTTPITSFKMLRLSDRKITPSNSSESSLSDSKKNNTETDVFIKHTNLINYQQKIIDKADYVLAIAQKNIEILSNKCLELETMHKGFFLTALNCHKNLHILPLIEGLFAISEEGNQQKPSPIPKEDNKQKRKELLRSSEAHNLEPFFGDIYTLIEQLRLELFDKNNSHLPNNKSPRVEHELSTVIQLTDLPELLQISSAKRILSQSNQAIATDINRLFQKTVVKDSSATYFTYSLSPSQKGSSDEKKIFQENLNNFKNFIDVMLKKTLLKDISAKETIFTNMDSFTKNVSGDSEDFTDFLTKFLDYVTLNEPKDNYSIQVAKRHLSILLKCYSQMSYTTLGITLMRILSSAKLEEKRERIIQYKILDNAIIFTTNVKYHSNVHHFDIIGYNSLTYDFIDLLAKPEDVLKSSISIDIICEKKIEQELKTNGTLELFEKCGFKIEPKKKEELPVERNKATTF